MEKEVWKPGNMLYPVPAVMVSCADSAGNTDILTVAWTGTVCSDPPMVSISVRPERYSYRMIRESGEFVINLTTEKLVRVTDAAGVKSGRDTDKWKELKLTPGEAAKVKAPLIAESPVNIECTVTDRIPLGSHDLFLARVEAVDVDTAYLDRNGKFDLNKAGLMVYSHGTYFALGELLGTYGYSVRKDSQKQQPEKSAEKKTTKRAGKPYGKSGAGSTGKPYGKTGVKAAGKPYGKTGVKAAGKPYGKTGVKAVEKPYGKTGVKAVEKPYGKTGVKAAGKPYGKTGVKAAGKPYGKTGVKAVEKPYGKTGVKAAGKPFMKAAGKNRSGK